MNNRFKVCFVAKSPVKKLLMYLIQEISYSMIGNISVFEIDGITQNETCHFNYATSVFFY